MKVLVTGGAGYIGSITVERLIKHGASVVVFDNLYQGHEAAVHPEATFVRGDLADKAAIDDTLARHKPDGIMHFASYTLVGESWEKPFLYLRDNIVNGLNLLESAAEHGVRRFILSSTANLFDDPENMPIHETERIVPGSPYGESKNIMERYLHWMDRVYGMRYACLRYFNACGATEERGEHHDPETHLIPLVLQVALGQRDKITIFGDDYNTPDGTCVRDYIHVMDLAEGHVAALACLDRGERLATLNLGTGQSVSVRELVAAFEKASGRKIACRVAPRRAGDVAECWADPSRAAAELGWRARRQLHEMCADSWNWQSRNPDGYP